MEYAHHLYVDDKEIINLVIPEEIDTINNYCFKGDTGFKSIVFHSNVKSIGYNAFSGCTSLEDVYCYSIEIPKTQNSIPDSNSNPFKDSYVEYATLHVPDESIVKYRPWGFGKIIALEDRNSEIIKRADVNQDGNVDISDIVAIINVIAGLK